MLILSRKEQEEIVVQCPDGTTFTITVVEIDRNKARLGFTAPPEVKFWRSELLPVVPQQPAA